MGHNKPAGESVSLPRQAASFPVPVHRFFSAGRMFCSISSTPVRQPCFAIRLLCFAVWRQGETIWKSDKKDDKAAQIAHQLFQKGFGMCFADYDILVKAGKIIGDVQ